MNSIAQMLNEATGRLGGNPLDAQLLLAHLLGKSRSWLYAWPEHQLNPQQQSAYQELILRRQQGEPLAYITGSREFWSLTLRVGPATLIPRPETEQLVELALQLPTSPLRVLDLGTGSGCIALALASERPAWQITAVDNSPAALEIARSNARQLNLERIIFAHSDWFEGLPTSSRFDLILGNPPYVAENDPHLQHDGLPYEPISALTAGTDGLNDLRRIIAHSPNFLEPGGWLLLEHGMEQGPAVKAMLNDAGFSYTETLPDASGRDRISRGCYPQHHE